MIDVLKPLIKQFMPFAQEKMGFKDPPRLFLRNDAENAKNPLGKTAYYDPGAKSVTIYVQDRHPKDIMRSLSHELVHHTQNCNGQFEGVDENEMGEGYAQNNDHLRNMESEAYEMGNLCFRDWEDSIKSTIYFEHLNKGVNKTMSTKDWKNKEIKTLLTEQWGFSFNLDHLNEGDPPPRFGSGGRPQDPSQAPAGCEEEEKDKDGNCPKSAWGGVGKDEPVDEGCPPDGEMMVVGDEMPGDEMPGDEGPVDTESLMAELLAVVEQLASAMGVGAIEDVEDDMDDIEEGGLAHRRGGVKDPRNRRPEASSLKEAQIRKMVREALKKIIVAKASQGK